jgi:serine protease Do
MKGEMGACSAQPLLPRFIACCALILALQCISVDLALAAPLQAPPLPPEAAVQPILLGSEGSESITLGNIVFRIATGTPVGNLYRIGRKKPLREDRWTVIPGRSREFDVATMDRLRAQNYTVVDSTQDLFARAEPAKARYQLGAVVSRAWRDFYFRYSGSYVALPDEGYGVANLDVEFQILDQNTSEVVFRKTYPGFGTDVAQNPSPLIPAFMNALDHALSDQAFVDQLRKPAANATMVASTPATPLRIPACKSDGGAHLPDDLKRVMPSVVTIRAAQATGTGVVVSPEGHVLTAAHLVTSATSITAATFSGMEFDASILRVDKTRDIAVLKLPGRGHSCAAVSRTLTLTTGADVFIVGSPLDKRLANSVTRGIMSGERTIDGTRYVQTDASVNPGNSGGPMFGVNGQIQAIVTTKVVGAGIEGLAFGVPTEVLASDMGIVFD